MMGHYMIHIERSSDKREFCYGVYAENKAEAKERAYRMYLSKNKNDYGAVRLCEER